MISLQEKLRSRLAGLGFDDVRFASVGVAPSNRLKTWLEEGMQADMAWMTRTAEKRLQPGLVLPGARSVIMLGVNYSRTEKIQNSKSKIPNPAWARYALNEDYHDTLKPALVAAGRILEELYGARAEDYRYYVDTGPVLERGWAARAGIGFIGKNAMLISRRHGNWLLLAAILTKAEFVPDEPVRKKMPKAGVGAQAEVGLLCGKCTRCLDVCPTQALPQPGVLDARRCISYQTIENKGIIPRELRSGIGNHIYGCDLCLEVCPWNRFAREGRRMLLVGRDEIAGLTLGDILELTPVRFTEVFRRTAIKRIKLTGLLRNACVVAGNSGASDLLEPLLRLVKHESSIVRAHAVWAVRQLGGEAQLTPLREHEKAAEVLAEYVAG